MMNKNMFTRETLAKGEMYIYDFGHIKLHAYKTNDLLDDEVFIVEKDSTAVIIESPCFFDNNKELEAYIKKNNLTPAGILLAYHMAGNTFLPDVKKYATKNADEYGHSGGGAALVQGFTAAFGESFDCGIHKVTDYLATGKTVIGGIEFIITPTPDAFDIEIPEINSVYTHMLGHDCHSIIAGTEHADSIIAQLKDYTAKGFTLVLTSHYTPEDLKDAKTKIAYIQALQSIAKNCRTAEEFKHAVKERYSKYSGENYLDMTAGFFFA